MTMDIAVNQRQEQRLCYRWPVSFARSVKEKPSPGQIFDVSSWNLSFLCHADKKCPRPEQLITVDFGVPYFDSADSFDTVFFNRIGRVSRVDKLTDLVNRVVVRFARPLFFKPGEQNISESDALQRLEAKAQSISKAEEEARLYSEALTKAEEKTTSYEQAKAKAEKKLKDEIKARYKAEAKLRDETEEKIAAYAEAKERAEEKAKIQALATAKARAKAESEAKARIEAESRAEAEIQARIEAQKQAKFDIEEIVKAHAEELIRIEERIKSYAEAKDRIEEKLNAEIENRCKTETNAIAQAEQSVKAEEKAKYEVSLRVQAQEKAEAETRKRKMLEAQMHQKIKSYNDQIAKIKAEAAEEIVKVRVDAENIIAGLKEQLTHNPDSMHQANTGTGQKTNVKTTHSPTTTLLKKVDKLIKDRGIIY